MKSDIPIKRVLQVRPMDWVRFLLPDIKDLEITELETEIIPKSKSQLDKLMLINGDFILHIEPNGYLDKTIPARMLRYRADIWEYTINRNMGTPSIDQVLILFYEKHDNKLHELYDSPNENAVLNYKYRVIKVWELSKDTVINEKLLGLYPLLPLMNQTEGETPDTVVENTIKIIETVKDEALRSDLLTALSVLAEEKYSKEIVRKYIRRETLMQSELLREFAMELVAEESEKARIEGEMKGKMEGEIKGKMEGEIKGKMEGEIKGKVEAKMEVAKNLIKLGLEEEKIILATGLVADQIKELRKIV